MKKIPVFSFLICLLFSFSAASLHAIAIPGGLLRETSVTPGSKSAGKIMVANPSAEPQTIKVYQTEYLPYADGRREFGSPGSNPRSNLEWVKVFPQQLTIQPKQTGYLDYSIQVPDKKDLAGTYWSAIMIEPLVPSSPELPKNPGKSQLGIQTVVRYSLIIVTNFENNSDKALKFIEKHLEVKGSEKFFQIDLEGIGNRLVQAAVWIEVYDLNGVSLGRFEGGNQRIFPNCSARFRSDLSQLPAGDYTALLIADIGNEKVFGAKYKLKMP